MYKKSIIYIAVIDPKTFPGVFNKIEQTVNALKKKGYAAQYLIIKKNGFFAKTKDMFIRILTTKADIIFLRNNINIFFIFPALIIQRLRKKRIIIDIPTPTTVVVSEIYAESNSFFLKKIRRILFLYITIPWSLWPANKVLQYANESWYFSLGLSSKTLLISNGINVDDIPPRNLVPKWPEKSFVLIGVASLAHWHGFDRVIRGIAYYLEKNINDKVNIQFFIVGEGEIKKSLEELSLKLRVSKNILFTGSKSGRDLDLLFEKSHVGVSSLGLSKIGINMASVLKSREYSARGIPFISAGYDLDFDPKPDFVLDFPNDNSSIDIKKIIDWYSLLGFDEKKSLLVRDYAMRKLDYINKVTEMLN